MRVRTGTKLVGYEIKRLMVKIKKKKRLIAKYVKM